MDESTYKARVERLRAVNATITELDQTIRAEAFALLKGYVTGETDDEESTGGAEGGDHARSGPRHGDIDTEQLVEKHESDKEYENALLALAVFYMRQGRAEFNMSSIREIAKEFNLDIPERVDVTLGGMKRDGSKLLRKQADGRYKVTQGGESWLQATYGVRKGKQPLS